MFTLVHGKKNVGVGQFPWPESQFTGGYYIPFWEFERHTLAWLDVRTRRLCTVIWKFFSESGLASFLYERDSARTVELWRAFYTHRESGQPREGGDCSDLDRGVGCSPGVLPLLVAPIFFWSFCRNVRGVARFDLMMWRMRRPRWRGIVVVDICFACTTGCAAQDRMVTTVPTTGEVWAQISRARVLDVLEDDRRRGRGFGGFGRSSWDDSVMSGD